MFHQIVTNADGVRQRHARNEGEGLEDALAHFIVLTTPYCIEMAAPLPMQRPSRTLPVMGPDVNARCTGQIFPFFTSQQNFIRYSLGVQCFISRKILIKYLPSVKPHSAPISPVLSRVERSSSAAFSTRYCLTY